MPFGWSSTHRLANLRINRTHTGSEVVEAAGVECWAYSLIDNDIVFHG